MNKAILDERPTQMMLVLEDARTRSHKSLLFTKKISRILRVKDPWVHFVSFQFQHSSQTVLYWFQVYKVVIRDFHAPSHDPRVHQTLPREDTRRGRKYNLRLRAPTQRPPPPRQTQNKIRKQLNPTAAGKWTGFLYSHY